MSPNPNVNGAGILNGTGSEYGGYTGSLSPALVDVIGKIDSKLRVSAMFAMDQRLMLNISAIAEDIVDVDKGGGWHCETVVEE